MEDHTTLDLSHPKPWEMEPDVFAWTDPTTGLKCLIRRNMTLGNLCGYVRITKHHYSYPRRNRPGFFKRHSCA